MAEFVEGPQLYGDPNKLGPGKYKTLGDDPVSESIRLAIFGYNPKTGKAFTEQESAAVSGGYLPENYRGIKGYDYNPETKQLTVLNASGMASGIGARTMQTSKGTIVYDMAANNAARIAAGQQPYGEDVVYDEYGVPMQYSTTKKVVTSGDTVTGTGTTQSPLVVNGIPYTGTYNNRSYTNGVLSGVADSAGSKFDGSGTTNSPLTVNGVPYNGVLGGVTYTNGIAKASFTEADVETKARRSAQQDFKAALTELGLGDLVDTVDEMIKQDFTVANIKLELPKTAAYINRFPGMAPLRAAGRAISEAQYISNERGYLQTLRAYGLDTNVLGSRPQLGTYIQNEVSPREFEERVNLASTRVRENPDVLNSFKSFYPEVDESGVVAYLLNPKQGLDIIKKQVKTVEIGAAARTAGFAKELVGIAEAGSLMTAVGETNYAGLINEFRQARQLAMNQRRLASIEGQQYTDLEAIRTVVGDDLEQALASQRRASREIARFGGSGGISAASLRSTNIAI